MAAAKNYGPKRLVVGAHYGVMDFIIQRITAVIMAVYTLVLLIGILLMPAFTYESWHALFTFYVGVLPVGQILATLAFIALAWHAWIGVRDIWMDYVKSVGVRLLLQVLTILWLIGSVVYFAQILWSI
ncbi:succinate dehydrogenase, hydrophobic membrane anchor protein [Achromobacter xylosoxidans]|jgi:succinate dehydrogenase / fumarate reductase, membrane anchor subunit|uniref:Succinate dehydrogenase hydrophobic membrane anchor subunit n=3 Tax=Pseudomonadota TaxID=1224 RepID=A0A1D8I5M6_9BURK|nr:succinate dehydrogenase, hydrophobic membrane anchor protein [Achromobacter ruhlandii]AKP88908.1 Succinate dehydrogenase hydrophobic membrane anchor protein [Achromobacter xylosoxidans]ALX82968.1 succinate dehydrogenase [Achromobacter denitrificans]AMG47693.1 succinate dehydrogenase, hydrophobic membrane anchor protein [Achromobacter xylosoxidans]AOU91768.1 succinate dehydrogenase [Achromobacter ruhlandii]MCI1839058.1 succinate dehydrogenase, hydrophobic membrane anchor protein [Achromobact